VTEAEWLTCDDPQTMLEFLQRKAEDRSLYLFSVACYRRVWPLLTEHVRQAIEVKERYADGLATEAQYRQYNTDTDALRHAFHAVVATLSWFRGPDSLKERAAQAHLLRDVAGNPFRPVTFSPSWRTDTALLLAQQMYDSRDFGAMPILADALQDAGCDNEDILNHCRAETVHVRGCWVVDLVLGKE
jgi:hypothetical protein